MYFSIEMSKILRLLAAQSCEAADNQEVENGNYGILSKFINTHNQSKAEILKQIYKMYPELAEVKEALEEDDNAHDENDNINFIKLLIKIFEAIIDDNPIQLGFLFSQLMDFNVELLVNGWTPLHAAISFNRKTAVRYLIRSGANVNAKFYGNVGNGCTLLHMAVWNSDLEVIKMLLSNQADVNAYEKSKGTPLMEAIRQGDLDMVFVLVKHGADINRRFIEGMTPLHIAAQSNNSDIIKFLLHLGVNVNTVTFKNESALHSAMRSGLNNEANVRVLLDAGIDINIENTDGKLAIEINATDPNNKYRRLILKQHIIKLREAKIGNVCQRNISKINSNKLDIFQFRCTDELTIMKELKFGFTCVTLYDMLTKSIDQLVVALKDVQDPQNFINFNLLMGLPLYCNMIIHRLIKVIMKIIFLNSSQNNY